MTRVLFVLALLVAGPVSAQTVRYVASTGSDSNPGTEALPYATIQKAATVVNPGDTVIVEDGTYTGNGPIANCNPSQNRPIVCLTRTGTSAAPITLKARNPQGAKLDGQHGVSTQGVRLINNVGFYRIEGFDIFGTLNHGSASGIELYSGGHDSTIINNLIHDIGRHCTDTTNGQSGIFVQQPRVTITGNTIRDIGRFAPGEQGCQPATEYYKNHDHGIYANGSKSGSILGAQDLDVSGNHFFNIARGWPIQLYPGTLARLKVIGNDFHDPNPYRVGHVIIAANLTDALFNGNSFISPQKAALSWSSGTYTRVTVQANTITGAVLSSPARPRGVTFIP